MRRSRSRDKRNREPPALAFAAEPREGRGTVTQEDRHVPSVRDRGASALALSAAPALARTYHHHYQHHRAARNAVAYGEESAAVAPEAALNPYGGPSVVAGRPVPDTARNRARFGEPLSWTGKTTTCERLTKRRPA